MSKAKHVKHALVLTGIVTGFAIAIAWPWGLQAMIASGCGAFFAGVALALYDVRPLADGSAASLDPIVIDRGADVATAANLASHLSERPQTNAAALFRDPMVRDAIRDRIDAEKIGAHILMPNAEQRLAQKLFGAERFFDQAYWRNQSCVHTLIVGDGPLAMACLEEAVFAGIAGDLAPPRITLLARDPAEVRAVLAFGMPELLSSVCVDVLPASSELPTSFEREVFEADAVSPLTCIVICTDDEQLRIRQMLWFQTIARRRDRSLAPVFILSLDRSPAIELSCPLGRRGDMGGRFVAIAGRDLFATAPEEATAQRMHEAYLVAFGGQDGSDVSWDDLPETYRIANRRAARHLPQKLWTAGLTMVGAASDTGDVAPESFATVVEPTAKSRSEDALIRRLARLEHDRWCADRRLQGWTFATERDSSRRHHPNLVSFDDPLFTDADIAKDIDQIRFLLSHATRPVPGGAAPPIVVAIIAESKALSGIGVDQALGLLEREPWRPVVLLGALLRDEECSMVDQIVRILQAAGRTFRLLVPELSHDNKHLRVLSSAGMEKLGALLRLVETALVPIYRGETPNEDEWADPDALAADFNILTAYLRQRAGAIVSASVIYDGQGPA